MNLGNISSISQNVPQGLDSVTGGLVASVDAKGIGAIQNGIDAFSSTGLDQAVVTGDKPIATEAGTFPSPAEYLQKQIPESGSPQVLEQLEDPHFNYTQALTSTFKNVFGDGGINDVANQLGMAQTPSPTSTNDPGEAAGGPHAMGDGSVVSDDAGASGGPTSTDADPGKIYTGDTANINPLRSAIQLSDLTAAPLKPGDSAAVGDGGVHPTDTGEGGPKMPNPLESQIKLSDLAGAQTGASSAPGSQFSDGVGDGGVHPTDTGEGGPKMPNPEDVAGRIDITDTGETSGEIIWQDNADSMAIMGQRGYSDQEPVSLNPLGSAFPRRFPEEDANPAAGSMESIVERSEDANQTVQSPFFLDLFQNNFSKLQTMGGTLNDLLTMQQDVFNRQ